VAPLLSADKRNHHESFHRESPSKIAAISHITSPAKASGGELFIIIGQFKGNLTERDGCIRARGGWFGREEVHQGDGKGLVANAQAR
jgi:hypothetical protein